MAQHPWQKQPNESKQAYQAFRLFRDMGPTRSVARVVGELGKSRTLLDRWASPRKWNWFERANAWDEEQDRLKVKAEQDAMRAMVDRQIAASMNLQGMAFKGLQEKDLGRLSPYVLLQMWSEGVRVERLNRGEPDSIEERREKVEKVSKQEVTVTIKDYAPTLEAMIADGLIKPPDELVDTNGHGSNGHSE